MEENKKQAQAPKTTNSNRKKKKQATTDVQEETKQTDTVEPSNKKGIALQREAAISQHRLHQLLEDVPNEEVKSAPKAQMQSNQSVSLIQQNIDTYNKNQGF